MPRKKIIYTNNTCLHCHSVFKHSIDAKSRKYCGYKCAKEARKRRLTLKCEQCGNEFEVWEYEKNSKYCTNKCHHESMMADIIELECANCKVIFKRKNLAARLKNKNNFCTKKCADIFNSGKNHYEWKDNLHDNNEKTALARWAKDIKNRDNNCCNECGEQDVNILHAHHIKSKSERPDLIFNYDNGVCLCLYCHLKKHLNDPKAFRLLKLKIEVYESKKEELDKRGSKSRKQGRLHSTFQSEMHTTQESIRGNNEEASRIS